jgi:hypothetical protein
MNVVKTLAAALLSVALLVGCTDAGPLGPGDALESQNARDFDGLPPLEDGDPPHPLPPAEVEDPVMPEPPVEDPPKPLPPPEDRGGKNSDRGPDLDRPLTA